METITLKKKPLRELKEPSWKNGYTHICDTCGTGGYEDAKCHSKDCPEYDATEQEYEARCELEALLHGWN